MGFSMSSVLLLENVPLAIAEAYGAPKDSMSYLMMKKIIVIYSKP